MCVRAVRFPVMRCYPHPLRRHRRDVPAMTPLVLGDELNVGPPPAAVVADRPGVLQPGPPSTGVLDLDRSGWIEPAFLDQSNRHFDWSIPQVWESRAKHARGG